MMREILVQVPSSAEFLILSAMTSKIIVCPSILKHGWFNVNDGKGMHLEQMHTTETEKFHHENGGIFCHVYHREIVGSIFLRI